MAQGGSVTHTSHLHTQTHKWVLHVDVSWHFFLNSTVICCQTCCASFALRCALQAVPTNFRCSLSGGRNDGEQLFRHGTYPRLWRHTATVSLRLTRASPQTREHILTTGHHARFLWVRGLRRLVTPAHHHHHHVCVRGAAVNQSWHCTSVVCQVFSQPTLFEVDPDCACTVNKSWWEENSLTVWDWDTFYHTVSLV